VKVAAAADHDVAYWLASAYLLQGRHVLALTWLQKAIDLGNENYLWFESDPNWVDLHDDPRFKEMMQKVRTSLQQREGAAA
jgi:eukaryotic-like serine/threonine-protein kinase